MWNQEELSLCWWIPGLWMFSLPPFGLWMHWLLPLGLWTHRLPLQVRVLADLQAVVLLMPVLHAVGTPLLFPSFHLSSLPSPPPHLCPCPFLLPYGEGARGNVPWLPTIEAPLLPQQADFQVRVLMRLDQILENQSEQMSLLQRLVTRQDSLHDMEDVLPEPVNTEQQLLALCDRISKEQTFSKQLIAYLASLGGANLGASVHRMLRKSGTNGLWSNYSLKGRKGKKFEDLPISRSVIH
ncbi:UNVERIFIED_CONTAM: hypothetical protein FKN15_070819 [Acipenser sinensis]